MADMASTIREKSGGKGNPKPDHSVKMTMLPGKRSIEYKLLKVRRFVNAKILYKFDQFLIISNCISHVDKGMCFRCRFDSVNPQAAATVSRAWLSNSR